MHRNIYLTKIFSLLVAFSLAASCSTVSSESSYVSEIEHWRAEYESKLKSEDGWLTLTGLYWLEEGVNTIGAGDEYAIKLTDNFDKGKFGEIEFRNGIATLTVVNGVEATADGNPVTQVELRSDKNGSKPTVVQTGSQLFYLIDREGRVGVRLKDKASPKRVNFTGLHWFPVDTKYRIAAKFEPFEAPVDVDIPNILGGTFKMKSPGILRFKIDGKEFTLQPVEEGEKLFIIFRDLSSKTETYQAGRFLYAAKPSGDEVVLDFNKAENPPCAYTEFATCPLPPEQNRLDIEIKAGETRFHD